MEFSLADPMGRKGCTPPLSPVSFIYAQFLGKFGQIIGPPPFWVGAPVWKILFPSLLCFHKMKFVPWKNMFDCDVYTQRVTSYLEIVTSSLFVVIRNLVTKLSTSFRLNSVLSVGVQTLLNDVMHATSLTSAS